MVTDISKLPHPKFFNGKPIYHHLRTFLEQTIDAEWRATCLKDSTMADWLNQFNLGFMVDYLINANYFTKDEVVSLSNEIRSNYDWNISNG
jgi:hypothetical protein|tara:strand:- start:709 stop:981 length:273 start_codon:yes stop_codon:yes gene_type:complete